MAAPPKPRKQLLTNAQITWCSGTVSGFCATFAKQPIQRVKWIRQTSSEPVAYATIARQLLRIAKEETRLAGVLFITTERGAVDESDATRFKDGIVKEAKELQRQHQGEKGGTCLLENVPMGFSDVDDEREGSWRELGNAREEEEGESWAPAAARASARRLRTFLEKEQGALNTFG